MSKVSLDDIKRAAELSAFNLSSQETDALGKDVASIIGYVDQLDELDTDGVEPTYQVTGLENIWRQDELVEPTIGREQLLNLAPESTEDSVIVPKVLK